MDQSEQNQQQPNFGAVACGGKIRYGSTAYQTSPTVETGTPAVAVSSPTQPPNPYPSQHQVAYHHAHQFHQQQQQQQEHHQQQQHQQQLQSFWINQMEEVEQATDFRNHSLPLARIKKIMKADEDVRMISAEAPVIFAKACEMFILELTLRSWLHTEENKRRTLQKNDIAAAISWTDIFDFLVDIIPRDELEEGLGVTKANVPMTGSPVNTVPYFYVPAHQPMVPTGMIIGKPVDQAALYASQQPEPPITFMPWLQPQAQPQKEQHQQQQSNER